MARDTDSVRAWVRDRIEGVRAWLEEQEDIDDESLLNPDVYPNPELREDKLRLERERERLETEMDEHRRQYRDLIERGAEADGSERQRLAGQAKLEKRTYQRKQRQRDEVEVKLATILTIEAARELRAEEDRTADLGFEHIADTGSTSDGFRARIEQRMLESDIDTETIRAVEEELGIDAPQTDPGVDEELALMESMADSVDVESMESIPDDPGFADFAMDAPPGSGDVIELGDFDGLDGEIATGSDIEVAVRQPADGLVETVVELRDHYLVCSMYDDNYAVTWEAQMDVEEFVDLLAPRGDETIPVETYFVSTGGQDAERRFCELATAREDDRFPGSCGFLALEFEGHELTWEREGTHTDGHELTAAVEGYDEQPFRTVFLRSLDGQLDESELTELLGRLTESLETDAPRPDSNGGDN